MEFLGFEDTTAIYDVTLFPDVYRRVCHVLMGTRPFLISGIVQEDFGVCTLTADHVERL
jgi:error-prone DNA polymerase